MLDLNAPGAAMFFSGGRGEGRVCFVLTRLAQRRAGSSGLGRDAAAAAREAKEGTYDLPMVCSRCGSLTQGRVWRDQERAGGEERRQRARVGQAVVQIGRAHV